MAMKEILTLLSFIGLTEARALPSRDFLLHSPDCELLTNLHYFSCYNPQSRQSSWTLHQLDRTQIKGSSARTNDYRPDYRVHNPVEETDYKYSGFDRGHMTPAADFKKDHHSMSETFLMSNMSPQRPEFNRGIWKSLEAKIRKDFLGNSTGETIIYTGAILNELLPTILTGVSIPENFYKIIYQYDHEHIIQVKAYLISNHGFSSSELESFRVTIDEIENLSGLDFFSFLDEQVEQDIESKI